MPRCYAKTDRRFAPCVSEVMRTLIGLALLFAVSPAAADPKVDGSDVQIIIGGNFAVDHIGPKAYTEIKNRALARPKVYLDIIDRFALASTPASLSSTYIPHAIGWIGANAKPEAKVLASRLLPLYRRARATATPASDAYRNQRLDERIAELVSLAK